ncbi:plasmid stabilization protein [Rhizobium sp. CSW-27]|uniref:FitA-like ribbon-helix-helix domain-containing protein n=1 Tax=Rhizobium sp. CSW-27 TaxID=2839985 RepID=UPI001C031D8D|nr:plasmid stabilization protein [Rhizobium sp. CSW-27]MBT9372094.1 plasmid stabilization protein [Rhizobium sp. CSW-27]
MGDLLIKGIPEAIAQGLSERAERAGRTLSEEVTVILGDALQQPVPKTEAKALSAFEAIREIMKPESEEEAALYAAIMDEIEAKRKSDLGRPFEDFE